MVNVGRTMTHTLHGSCVVLRILKNGTCWISVWGGINGDKLYTFKGISQSDLR